MARLFARIRLPLQYAGFVALLATLVAVVLAWSGVELGPAPAYAAVSGVVLIGIAGLLTFVSPRSDAPSLELAAPVRGRWQAVNSPTTKIPSHGTHAYGQTFAVDLVHLPEGVEHPEFGKAGGSFLPPDRFPAFGQPLFAPADGVVVRTADTARDHLSRSSYAAVAYLYAESFFRELGGARRVLGNHLVLRLDDGTHFVFAHLRRGSIRVPRGARVAAGDVVAECGNSGNTTEPHLHCQRQDIASTFVALGLAWSVSGPGIPAEGKTADF